MLTCQSPFWSFLLSLTFGNLCIFVVVQPARGLRTRPTRETKPEKTESNKIEPPPGLSPAPLRSDNAIGWRRTAVRANGTPDGPAYAPLSRGTGQNRNHQEEDRVPEWMVDDLATAAVQDESAPRGDSANALGLMEENDDRSGKKKLKGLEELQSANDEIAAYRMAMKEKERRLRGEPAIEHTGKMKVALCNIMTTIAHYLIWSLYQILHLC